MAQTPEQAPLSVATEVCSDMFPSEHEDETIASIASLQSPPNSTRDVSSIPATHTSTPTTTPADHTNALTEFELFPNFPMELRLKIWKYAVPGPRVINVRSTAIYFQHAKKKRLGRQLTSNTPIPAILHACKESRTEALQMYQLGLASFHRPSTVYIDFSRDTIYFGHQGEDENEDENEFTLATLLSSMSPQEFSKIRYLSMLESLYRENFHTNTAMLAELPYVVEFSCVNQIKDCEETSSLKFVKRRTAKRASRTWQDGPWSVKAIFEWDTLDEEIEEYFQEEYEHTPATRRPPIVLRTLAPADYGDGNSLGKHTQ